MLKALSRIFGTKPKEGVRQVHDPVLGTLRLAGEGWWEATVVLDGRSLGFKIGDNNGPDPALMDHARDLLRGFPEFNKMIGEFLLNEAKRMPAAAEEIRQLEVEDVMLFWPKRPHDGMIYFRGPHKYRVWRCDYVDRKPQGLGFDD